MSEGYAGSKERIDKLQQMVSDAKEARVILKYVDLFVSQAKEGLIKAINKDPDNISEAVYYYKAAENFAEMVKYIITKGERKADTLRELRKQENK